MQIFYMKLSDKYIVSTTTTKQGTSSKGHRHQRLALIMKGKCLLYVMLDGVVSPSHDFMDGADI